MAKAHEDQGGAPPVRPHPKPPHQASTLNGAIRQELWYLDTIAAAPFRAVRRSLGSMRRTALTEGLDELLWAAEGMVRLPVKLLQAAFGEEPAGRPPGDADKTSSEDDRAPKGPEPEDARTR
ncbi:MAG: hypothetical protein K6V97_14435 [Actinomycetia bacterium]|jgi:hypothetical protein|nr:hypothetical protein [Actinomycetes bacterium]